MRRSSSSTASARKAASSSPWTARPRPSRWSLAVYEELIRAGAFPVVRLAPSEASEIFFKLGKPHHFTSITPLQRAMADYLDGSIYIDSSPNTRALSAVDPKKQAL